MSIKLNSAKPKQRHQKQHKRASEWQFTYLVVGVVAFFVLLIALMVFISIERSRPVTGEDKINTLGNAHIPEDKVVTGTYNSTPPTSGPHYGNLVEWDVYTQPVPYQMLLHNMEDGGIIVYYQCPDGCSDTVDALTSIVNAYIDDGQRLVLAPNIPGWSNGTTGHADMGAQIVVTAWNRILKMDAVDVERIRAFVDKYQGIDHHRAGA